MADPLLCLVLAAMAAPFVYLAWVFGRILMGLDGAQPMDWTELQDKPSHGTSVSGQHRPYHPHDDTSPPDANGPA